MSALTPVASRNGPPTALLLIVPTAAVMIGCGGEAGPTVPDHLETPVAWTAISAGRGNFFAFTCGLAEGGLAYCWGNNSTDQLGNDAAGESAEPVPVRDGLSFRMISAGWKNTCGLDQSGAAYCWGQLEPNTPTPWGPVEVPGGLTFELISNGGTLFAPICGLTVVGAAYCWTIFDWMPVPVPGGHTFDMLSAGRAGACGVTTGGEVYCWDRGGSLPENGVPQKISGELLFKTISVGGPFCGLTVNGAAYCRRGTSWPLPWWGYAWGAVPGGLVFEALAQGPSNGIPVGHNCALTAAGAAYCWGDNRNGQLGDGKQSFSSDSPVAVSGGLAFRTLTVGGATSCGITVDAEVT